MNENQQTIVDWSNKTFGILSTQTYMNRTLEEIQELYDSTTPEQIMGEIADVIIMLMSVAESVGGDIQESIDEKMKINRERKWIINDNGTGQHATN